MHKDDVKSGLFFFAIALLTCLGASRYEVGTFKTPGTGFFPLLLGIVIGLFALIILARALSGRGETEVDGKASPAAGKRKEVVFILALLAFCGFFLEKLGYPLTIMILSTLLFWMGTSKKWYVVLGGGILASMASYTLFRLLLNIQLPRGIIGI